MAEVKQVEEKEKKRCQVCARKLDEKACTQFCANNLENCLNDKDCYCCTCEKEESRIYVRGREWCMACSDKCAADQFDYIASRLHVADQTQATWYCTVCHNITTSWNRNAQLSFYEGVPVMKGCCLACEKKRPRRSERLAIKSRFLYDNTC